MRKLITILIILICISMFQQNSAVADDITKSGTAAAQFLKIPVGARAVGMGGAYVALTGDATSMYWNPAGLPLINNSGTVVFAYNRWLADTQFNYVAAAVRMGNLGVLGLSFTALSMADMEVRTEFEPEGTGEYFSAMDLALGVSYARSITDRFRLGFTMKYVRQQIWHMSASSMAFDMGIQFQTDFKWLTLGMCVSNFGPKLQYTGKDVFINYDFDPDQWGDNENIFANLQTDKWDLPLLFRFGLAMNIMDNEWNQLTGVVEARHPNDNEESLNMGLEYGFRQRFFLRTGYQTLFESKSERGLTLGVGIVYYLSENLPLRFDYSFASWRRLMNVHRITAEIGF